TTSCGCRTWSGRGSAGTLSRIPGTLCLSTKPVIATGQFARGQFRDQNSTGIAQHFDDTGIVLEHLTDISARAPLGFVSLHRDDVFGSPGNSVQRPSVFSLRNFGVGLFRLRQTQVVEEGHRVIEFLVVTMEARKIHLS